MNRIRTRAGEVAVATAGRGPDLVYLHGETGPVADDPFVATLADRFTVHAPHWPGFGESDEGPALREMLDFTLHGLDVVDALGLTKPILVGHSFGGMIAAEMAAVARHDVDVLVLVAPTGLWLDDAPIPDLFTKMPYELPELLFADPAAGARWMTGVDFRDAEAAKSFLVRNARQLGMAGRILFPIPERGLAERLPRVRASTRIVWGARDRYIPRPYGEAFAAAIAGADLVEIADAGHMVPFEAPARLASEVANLVSRDQVRT